MAIFGTHKYLKSLTFTLAFLLFSGAGVASETSQGPFSNLKEAIDAESQVAHYSEQKLSYLGNRLIAHKKGEAELGLVSKSIVQSRANRICRLLGHRDASNFEYEPLPEGATELLIDLGKKAGVRPVEVEAFSISLFRLAVITHHYFTSLECEG